MLSLPLSLWLSFTPMYLSSMGSGTGFGANAAYTLSKRAAITFDMGTTTDTSFKDRNGSLDYSYDLIKDRLNMSAGFGFDQYDLYGAGPTVDKNMHCTVKVKVF